MASDGIFLTEFLAEDELVNIVPNQRLDAIRLAKVKTILGGPNRISKSFKFNRRLMDPLNH